MRHRTTTALPSLLSISVFFSVCALVVYVGVVLYPLWLGPRIHVHDTVSGNMVVTHTSAYTLTGTVQTFDTFLINGRQIIPRSDGTFSERMLLTDGSNTVVIDAYDNFGVHSKQEVIIVHAPEKSPETQTARIIPLVETLSF